MQQRLSFLLFRRAEGLRVLSHYQTCLSIDERLHMALVAEEQVGLQRSRISVVIPARNKAQNLAHVLPHISSFVGEVILVDGHSTDDTIPVAEQLLPHLSTLSSRWIKLREML